MQSLLGTETSRIFWTVIKLSNSNGQVYIHPCSLELILIASERLSAIGNIVLLKILLRFKLFESLFREVLGCFMFYLFTIVLVLRIVPLLNFT